MRCVEACVRARLVRHDTSRSRHEKSLFCIKSDHETFRGSIRDSWYLCQCLISHCTHTHAHTHAHTHTPTNKAARSFSSSTSNQINLPIIKSRAVIMLKMEQTVPFLTWFHRLYGVSPRWWMAILIRLLFRTWNHDLIIRRQPILLYLSRYSINDSRHTGRSRLN